MTVVVAWLSGNTAMLCWDSAVTRTGHIPKNAVSSFGETQLVSAQAVEEGVLKVCNVNGLPALVTGDVAMAMSFIGQLRSQMEMRGVREAMAELDHTYRQSPHFFSVIIAHRIGERTVLSRYAPGAGVWILDAPDGHTCWVDGSLPDYLKRLVRTGAHAVDQMSISSARRLLAVLALMQSMSTAYYLPEHGVGGAFCGAMFDGAITWQEPTLYFLSDPPTLAEMTELAKRQPLPYADPFRMIRCQVSDWIGLVTSSITAKLTLLHSPTDTRTVAQLQDHAHTMDEPLKWLATSSAYAFINVARQRVVVALPRVAPRSALVTIEGNNLFVDRLITDRLQEPLEANSWDFVVLVDKESGGRVQSFQGKIDLEHPIDPPESAVRLFAKSP